MNILNSSQAGSGGSEKCVEANACKYSYFKKVLGMVQDNHSGNGINGTGKLPSHTNIRGKEAYK